MTGSPPPSSAARWKQASRRCLLVRHPDGRPGASVLVLPSTPRDSRPPGRARWQTVLTCATTALLRRAAGCARTRRCRRLLRHFGDKFNPAKSWVDGDTGACGDGRGVWSKRRSSRSQRSAVAPADPGERQAAALAAAEAAVDAIRRSAASSCRFLRQSSAPGQGRRQALQEHDRVDNEAYCPTVRGRLGVASELPRRSIRCWRLSSTASSSGDRRGDAPRARRRV